MLSKFHIKIIWLIGLVILTIGSFNLELTAGMHSGVAFMRHISIILFRVISCISLLIWIIGLGEILKRIISLKYKITYEEYHISVKYLTFSTWLLIPYWHAIEININSIEFENIFGGNVISYYDSNVTYNTEEEAMLAIENHKIKIKKNREDWFKTIKREPKKIKYI